ncbi:hypothetical protein SAMD00024442_37_18 [Candidatus Symbiothrix dinenymphae]|nr:hypothetical protein SAMD00024442_37_18 [Candidatus Symbiothrix dinenymphae]
MNLFETFKKLFKHKPTEVDIQSAVEGVYGKDSNDSREIIGIIKSKDADKQSEIIDHINAVNAEIETLEDKKKQLSERKEKIAIIEQPDFSHIEETIKIITNLLQTDKPNSTPRFIFKIRTPNEVGSFIANNSLLTQFKQREVARKKKEERNKKQIKEKLAKIEIFVEQGKLDEAKLLIAQIQKEIGNHVKHEIVRLNEAIRKLKEKELLILKKRQEEEQKRRDEEANRLAEIEKQRQEKLRIQREQEERERKAKLEKQQQEKAKLEVLLEKKPNWQEFQQVLQQNGITTLYHFTDRTNIKSIKEHGGLYSWHYCDNNGIEIPFAGGGTLSRQLDRQYNLQDYVRVSFTQNHPMMFVAKNEGRIQNPVILTISLDVCNFAHTRFADMNATKTGHSQGQNIEDLKRIHFRTVKLPNHFDLNDFEKPYFQAEILVKTWIPIEFITNINNF